MSLIKRWSGMLVILPVLLLLGPACPEPPPPPVEIQMPESTSGGVDEDRGAGDFERQPVDWFDENNRAGAGYSDPSQLSMRCKGADYLPVELGGVEMEVWLFMDGECYPTDQFTVRCPEGFCNCTADHWHDTLVSLSGKVRYDDGTCGSASIDEMSMFAKIWVSPNQADWHTDIEEDIRQCGDAECLEGLEDSYLSCTGGECDMK